MKIRITNNDSTILADCHAFAICDNFFEIQYKSGIRESRHYESTDNIKIEILDGGINNNV